MQRWFAFLRMSNRHLLTYCKRKPKNTNERLRGIKYEKDLLEASDPCGAVSLFADQCFSLRHGLRILWGIAGDSHSQQNRGRDQASLQSLHPQVLFLLRKGDLLV